MYDEYKRHIKMKNLFNKKTLLLSLFITTSLPAFAAEEDQRPLGLKAGFFGQLNSIKVKKNKASSSSEKPEEKKEEITKAREWEEGPQSTQVEKAVEPPSIWLDSRYYGDEASNSIFERIKMYTQFSEGKEKLFRSNLALLVKGCQHPDNEVRRVAVNNKGLQQTFFFIKARANTKEINTLYAFCNQIEKTYMDETPRPCTEENPRLPIIAMQILDHIFLTAIFTSTNPIQDGFITVGSNEERGSLVINESFCDDGNSNWSDIMPKPIIHYYKENAGGLELYRTYFDHTDIYDGIRYLPEHSFFKGYEFTQIRAMTYLQADRLKLQHTGYLLNKDGTLCERSGIAFIHRNKDTSRFDGPKAEDPVRIYRYYFSPWVGQHTFSLLESSHWPSREIRELINLVGGVDKIKHDELIFLPDVNLENIEKPTYDESVFLLPYLYELRGRDGVSEPLNRAILRIENIMVDAAYEEQSAEAMIEVEQDIGEQVAKEIEIGGPKAVAAIDERAKQIYTAYKRPKPGKKNWGEESRKARDSAKQQLKEEQKTSKLTALTEEEKTRLKKEKILEKIRQQYLTKTKDRRHFDSSEVTDMLASMRRSFARAEITTTGVSATRGSHTGTEMSTAGGGSVKLGLAKRPQTDGYEAGTVRTIINNHINRILSTLL